MKKILFSVLMIASLLGMTSCHEITTEDHSILTYYVAFELVGDPTMLVTVGTSYTDPGVIATEKGIDAQSKVVVSGDVVDPNTIGLYKVVYSATNIDGYESSISRTVIVCNPAITTDISGTYITTSETNRSRSDGGSSVSYSGYTVTITKIAPGFFSISDFFGGYYNPRLVKSNAAYELASMTGYVQLNADNTLGLLTSYNELWEDSLTDLKNGVYDPAAKTLYWEAIWPSTTFDLSFNVKLLKQ